MKAKAEANRLAYRNNLLEEVFKEMKKKHVLYLMMVPGIIAFFLFNYFPLAGIVVAFKNYNFKEGIFGSPWIGFQNFSFFLSNDRVWHIIWNTIYLNLLFILCHTLLQVVIALMLNEVKKVWYKKVTQSIIFLPHFISWIIVSVFLYNLFHYDYGTLNGILKSLGMEPLNLFGTPSMGPFLLVLAHCWKSVGYGVIIYLATLAGISDEYYEAATIDGATRWQKIRFISIPLLMPTIVVLTLLAIGRILYSDFSMFYAIVGDNAILFPTTDVIDTYVYRALRVVSDVGMASAVGFFQSVIGFFIVLGSNQLARRYQEDGALF